MSAENKKIYDARREWEAPAVSRMKAGEAEIGTRQLGVDGAFTTS